MKTMHEAIEEVLAKPQRTFTKEEAHELLMHLGVIDDDGNIQEPFQELFVRRQ